MINLKQFILGPSVWILLGLIIVAIGVYRSAEQTKRFEAEVKSKNAEITRLNEYILNSITGGDSFCRLQLNIGEGTNNAMVSIINQGEYSMYDVGCTILDLEQQEKTDIEINNIDAGTVSPHSAQIKGKLNLGSGNEKNTLLIFVHVTDARYNKLD